MKHARAQGFTLLEMVVVMAVFSTTILVAVDVYFTTIRVERSVGVGAELQNDARNVLESMVREVRLGRVDYTYYRNPINDGHGGNTEIFLDEPVDILAVRDVDNNQIFYRLDETDLKVCSNLIGAIDYCDAPEKWIAVNPDSIDVTDLQFIVSPSSDPAWIPVKNTDCKNSLNFEDIGVCTCNTDLDCLADQTCQEVGLTRVNICVPPDAQPIVTITMEITGAETKTSNVSARFQTTAASRVLTR